MMTIVPTVDVEGVHGERPFEEFILGEVGDGEAWGVFRIADVFRRYGVSGTFFVDCYEYSFWGEEKLQRLCQALVAKNQDVQLHTHPAWRDDVHDGPALRSLKRERSFYPQALDMMAKLDLSQQLEVIEHGKELLQRWIGCVPVAHRSGGYSINADTVAALARAGIYLDSSMNVAHRNSQVTWSSNRVVAKDGIVELPVTVLDYCFRLGAKCYSKRMKTDIDSCSVDDFVAYVDQGLEQGLKVMTVFLHSYSLLQFDPFYKRITPNPDHLRTLEQVFERLRGRRDVRFMSCAEFCAAHRADPASFEGPDAVPEVTRNRRIMTLATRKIWNGMTERLARTFDSRNRVMTPVIGDSNGGRS